MSNVDLSALRIDDTQTAIPKRPIGPRLLIAAVSMLAIAVAATFLVPIIWPPRAVRMEAVQSVSQGVFNSAASAAEAVGWIEADPFSTIVQPLVSGHIESLDVLEGDVVKANETIIARLVSAELQAAVQRTQAAVAQHRAQVAHANAQEDLARQRLEQNAETLLRIQEAQSKLAAIQTKQTTAVARLPVMVAKADSAAATAQAQERLQTSGQSSPVALQRARADNQAAIAAIDEVKAEISSLLSEHKNQTATLELCKDLAANPVDLRGALAITSAETAKANAQLKQAEVEVEIAKRELNWATVLAPIDGVVLRLEAEPGEIVGHAAKGIVTLYNPAKLRARIDVPIDSLRGIREGQEVEITSDAIGDVVVKGIVQRFQHESDMLKNTLQVKIGLFDPPALLRPETLCRARFLASQSGANDGEQTIITAFRIPLAAITDGKTYIFDPKNGTARAVTIEVIGEEGDMRIVRGPLSPTHRVVIGQVTDGESIMELKL